MSIEKIYAELLRTKLWEATRSPVPDDGNIVSALKKIADHGDVGSIRFIISYLWNPQESVVFQVAATICALLIKAPVYSLPNIDMEIRQSWPSWEGRELLSKILIARIKSVPTRWWTFAALASHPSGFVRQAALEELAQEESGLFLPFILLRTNDWVGDIRDFARKVLSEKLHRAGIEMWDRCLPLLFRMRRSTRHVPTELFESIEKIVVSRHDGFSLGTYPGAPSSFLRYRITLSKLSGNVSTDQLIVETASHPDFATRILACDWLSDASNAMREKYGPLLLEDISPIVRTRAFWRIANADPEKYLPYIERGMMDKSAAVQDTARGAWKLLLRREALPFYREQIAHAKLPSTIVVALRGLRAVSNLQDEGLVRPFLAHGSARVRTEALRTLAGWNAPDTIELLREALYSASPFYSKSAAALLMASPKLISAAMAKELLVNPQRPAVYKTALRLLLHMPKWTSLPLLLLAYSIPEYRESVSEAFEHWNRYYNRIQGQPSNIEAMEAIRAFQDIAQLPLAKHRDLIAAISYLESVR